MQTPPLPDKLAEALQLLDTLRQSEQWTEIVECVDRIRIGLDAAVPPAIHADLSIRRANAACQSGLTDVAREEQLSGHRWVRDSGSEDLRARWELNGSQICYRSGDLDGAERHAFACLASADLLPNADWLEAQAHNNIGLVALHRGDWSVARRHLLVASDLSLRAGDLLASVRQRCNYSTCCYWSGHWREGRASAEEALAEAQQHGFDETASALSILLGNIGRLENKTASAREHLAAARDLASRRENPRELALADELAGDLALDAGDLDEAAQLYTRTIDTGLRIAPRGDLVYEGRRKLADVRRMQGRYAEARDLAQNALDLARAAGTVVEIGASLRILALTYEALGDIDAARTHATEGIDILRGVHERFELLQLLTGCADFLDEPSALLIEARGLASQLGLTETVRSIDQRLMPPAQRATVGDAGMALVAEDAHGADAPSAPRAEMLRISGNRTFLTTDVRIIADVQRAMRNQQRVLIEGETGTGKELVARLLHENSPRKGKPFVCVECTSLHESLGHSELFGHAKGSFTGATSDGRGLVDAANGGTLFLDEVGDLSPAMQGRLLRFLQEREFRPVGAASAKPVDLFVIAATNRDLIEMVAKGEFRSDLYYRLKGAVVRVPPLRERPDDILPLAEHFLRIHGDKRERTIALSPQVRVIMRRYAWPGNARQLENEIDNIISQLEDGATANTWVLSPEVVAGATAETARLATFKERVDALIVSEVQRCLRATGGNRARTAEMMGFSRRGLQKMLKRLGLVSGTTDAAPATAEDDDSDE